MDIGGGLRIGARQSGRDELTCAWTQSLSGVMGDLLMSWVETVSRRSAYALSLVMSVLAIYVTGIALFDEGMLRGGAVGLAGVIVLLSDPLALRHKDAPRSGCAPALWLLDAILLVGFVFTIWWFFQTYESLWEGVFILAPSELFIALFGIAVIIELTRRGFGSVLAALCALAIVYGMYGAHLPWFFAHAGFSFEETMRAVWYSFDGVFGFPVGIIASIVVIFIVFGALLEGTGAGAILIKMSTAATARIRGGPAHAAIAASALFGTISGSPVANVVATGVFTIPLIKRQGFPPSFAAAVEAAASSGGQFTPAGHGGGRLCDGRTGRRALSDGRRSRRAAGAVLLCVPVRLGLYRVGPPQHRPGSGGRAAGHHPRRLAAIAALRHPGRSGGRGAAGGPVAGRGRLLGADRRRRGRAGARRASCAATRCRWFTTWPRAAGNARRSSSRSPRSAS